MPFFKYLKEPVQTDIKVDSVGLAKDTTVQYEPLPRKVEITIPFTDPNIDPAIEHPAFPGVYDATRGFVSNGTNSAEVILPVPTTGSSSGEWFFISYDVNIAAIGQVTTQYVLYLTYKDANNYARVSMLYDSTVGGQIQVQENVGGTLNTLVSTTVTTGTWHNVIIEIEHSRETPFAFVRLIVDNTAIGAAPITVLPLSQFKLVATTSTATYPGFKNLRILYIKQ